ncbi:class I SAM-dependent methyltransferase [Breoghania sp.]|uniref:class I SAM-dependent methyltransferase n=1 Tax=Breoghania sp. TaxID=2065378 RepID=UPI002AA95450|nr:class I SAM-dependent methyltransferase [Breoghania sp.]
MSDGFFAPPGHYYSPIPDLEDVKVRLERMKRFNKLIPAEINLDPVAMVKFWHDLAPFVAGIPFTDHAEESTYRYNYINNMYSYGDATIYYGILCKFRPKRIIEIGSGHSSALALDTIDAIKSGTKTTFIEPYPINLHKLIGGSYNEEDVRIIEDKIQNVSTTIFKRLEHNDILFIDSSHVAKTGSDLLYELFEILPILKPGVIVHFHDIFWPFEYPERWLIKENRAWNEVYFVRAFLTYNKRFQILFFNDYFGRCHGDEVAKYDTPFGKNPGGGLWLRRL